MLSADPFPEQPPVEAVQNSLTLFTAYETNSSYQITIVSTGLKRITILKLTLEPKSNFING